MIRRSSGTSGSGWVGEEGALANGVRFKPRTPNGGYDSVNEIKNSI